MLPDVFCLTLKTNNQDPEGVRFDSLTHTKPLPRIAQPGIATGRGTEAQAAGD